MKNMYLDGEYVEKHPTYHVEDSPWKSKQVLKMLTKHNLRPNSICEIGCGAGEILRQLQLHMSNKPVFHGYDISPQAITLSKKNENSKLQFFCENMLSIETRPYDLLLCMDVFEHVDDYMGFLRKLRHKSIYKVFHVPLDISVQTVLRAKPIVEARTALGHLHYFTKETALMTLEDTGYEIVDWFYTQTGMALGKSLKTKLVNIPRMLLSFVHPDLSARIFGRCSVLVLAK